MALTRQWKNVLYMPVETTFKSKRKVQNLAVTFRIPKEDSVENFEVITGIHLVKEPPDILAMYIQHPQYTRVILKYAI